MEHPDFSFINTQLEGIEKLDDMEAEASNVGLIMEGSTADFIKPRHCGFYTVGQLDERSYALAFPKGTLITLFAFGGQHSPEVAFSLLPSCPGFESQLCRDLFTLLLSL